MSITKKFRDAVSNNDIRLVRIMIKNDMIVDPSMDELNQMISIAEPKLTTLYDDHNGEVLDYEKSNWTKDYMDQQMVEVVNNFSKERLELLQNICQYLYKDKVSIIFEQKNNKNSKNQKIAKNEVGLILLIGGVIAVAVGLAIYLNR